MNSVNHLPTTLSTSCTIDMDIDLGLRFGDVEFPMFTCIQCEKHFNQGTPQIFTSNVGFRVSDIPI